MPRILVATRSGRQYRKPRHELGEPYATARALTDADVLRRLDALLADADPEAAASAADDPMPATWPRPRSRSICFGRDINV